MTQDFARPAVDRAFLQGVVYSDTDNNHFYTQGEGISGIIVTSPQSSFYTISSASGGYTLPLDEINGASVAQVVFNDNHGHFISRRVACGNNVTDNIKADLVTSLHQGAFTALSVTSLSNASRTTMKQGKLRISREGSDLTRALTIHYEVSGSAVAGEDYQPLKGWTVVRAGAKSVYLKVNPIPVSPGNSQPQKLTVKLQKVDQAPVMAWGKAEASVIIN